MTSSSRQGSQGFSERVTNRFGMHHLFALSFLLVAVVAGSAEAQNPLTIQNDWLKAQYSRSSGSFSLAASSTGHIFVTSGILDGAQGTAKLLKVTSAHFGAGQAIDIVAPSGQSAQIALYPKLPFALLTVTLKNTTDDTQAVNRVPVTGFDIDLGKPPAEVTTFGTGGLAAADQNPGSYAWLAVADPTTRSGVVTGWITHDRASGILFPSVVGNAIHIAARSDYGRLNLAPGTSYTTETLGIGWFGDARIGLERWADTVAKVYSIHLHAQPAGFCTWYADTHGGSSDEKDLGTLVDAGARDLKPYGLQFVQIDDGWQLGDSKGNGPHKNFTDFNPNGPYPSGMKAMADAIKAKGLTPGIWFMPFAGTYNDPWFASRQDFFAKRAATGEPYDMPWGGTGLDMTNPKVRTYLAGIVNRFAHDWGYTYFKMDGLYTGMAVNPRYVSSSYKEDDFGDALFFDKFKTNVEAYRSGLKLVRDNAGPNVFLLGCCVAQNMRTYEASLGLLDAMRIGADNNGSWHGWLRESPVCGTRNYFLNGRVWYNDPDPIYVRESLTTDEARTIASWAAVSGALDSDSDWIPNLPQDRLDILQRTMPAHGATARPVDFFQHDPAQIWTVTDSKFGTRRDIMGIFNWSDQPQSFSIPTSELDLPSAAKYALFDYWANDFLPDVTDTISSTLPPHACQIIAIRPALDHPFVLSTSRNVCQGITDVANEHWDAKSHALSGTSHVVAGETYELRIAQPARSPDRASATATERSSAVSTRVTQDGDNLRVEITSPANGDVAWNVVF